MTKLNVNERIEMYIEKIEPVNEGGRDNLLHNTGLLLRKNFGLQSDSLSEWLHIVNDKKCLPKLDVADVTKIARSVDKSTEVPLGDDSARCPNTPSKRHNTQKQSEKIYAVTIANTPVAVEEYLKKEISAYENQFATTTIGKLTIENFLNLIRTGSNLNVKSLIERIRKESDKEKRSKLKQKLPAFVCGSEPQEQRKNAHCQHNDILCIDFDNIPIDKIESAKTAIVAVGYIFAVGLSVSGNGLFALAAYEGTPDLKHLLAGMQNDFCYPVDTSRSDLCGLRFVTLDENLIVKDKVYPAVLSKQAELQPAIAYRETGVAVLDSILAKIKRVDWKAFANEKSGVVSETDYILRTIERTLETASIAGHPIVDKNGTISNCREFGVAEFFD